MSKNECDLAEIIKAAGVQDNLEQIEFPWGLEINDEKGEVKISAGTPDQYRAAVYEATGQKLSDEELQRRKLKCVLLANGFCSKKNCTGTCIKAYNGSYWYCYCK